MHRDFGLTLNEHFAMILNVGPVRKNFVTINQPYRLLEGRILWVTEGWADIELTMEAYHIEKGNILMVPPETIIELKRHSEDYNMIGIYCCPIKIGKGINA